MKKYIPYVIITVLLMVIASGVTYIVISDKEDNNKINENNSQNNNTNNNNGNSNIDSNDQEENKEEQITLSESELEEYLSYVPYNFYAYEEHYNMAVQDLENHLLLGKVLYNLSVYKDDLEVAATYEEANEKMQKMYNTKLGIYENSYDDTGEWIDFATTYNGLCYTFEDNKFIVNFCSSTIEWVDFIDSYKATENELIIYSYAAIYDSMNGNEIIDMHSGYKVNLELPDEEYLTEENVINYLKEYKGGFTKYKHTYKKNDTGYYWYSTEVVE